jgi:hypothetical protein
MAMVKFILYFCSRINQLGGGGCTQKFFFSNKNFQAIDSLGQKAQNQVWPRNEAAQAR